MTPSTSHDDGKPRLRADAARNRAQILTAARDAFRELGTAAPLDEIARRAGVNIATLYRRFPDRDALVRQVVVDGFVLVRRLAREALEAAPADPLAAIEGLLLSMVDEREMLVLPLIGGPVTDDPEALELQRGTSAAMEELLAGARARGVVRPDATAVDLITTAALACRPLPYLPAELATAVATRHVRIFVDGLRPAKARPLPPAPTYEEVTAHLRPAADADR
ncbi:TetR/AcrR family transcriptional regulator [Streptomyces broussonetiae]|uniref:TetR family transcriptional regulator n=1 Tax=Streptomyces broussonetiae TaxID=2686304 RepID=A0A6I6NFN1_9ACTN|nr:TetR/AcrR family transcriptional regulator [Streptomyces broussonetiae]QHA08960.1 TetR family transcriptional regulator [Streptomyces broussonetiae]